MTNIVSKCLTGMDLTGINYLFKKKGQGDGEFNEPHCLAVNKAGSLMVMRFRHRITDHQVSCLVQ